MRSLPERFLMVGRENGHVREYGRPAVGRRKRVRDNSDSGNESKARRSQGENSIWKNKGRPRLLRQRISCHKGLLPVGEGGLHPASAGSRLCRSDIPRSTQL